MTVLNAGAGAPPGPSLATGRGSDRQLPPVGARGVGSPSNRVLQAPFPAEMLLLGCKEDSRNGSFSIAQVSEMFLIPFSPHSLAHAGLEAATHVKCWLLV